MRFVTEESANTNCSGEVIEAFNCVLDTIMHHVISQPASDLVPLGLTHIPIYSMN